MDNDGNVSFTMADHHGTGQLAIDAATQTITQRRTLPFGATRGEDPAAAWPGTRSFVGGTNDTATGLTNIGAREYDPALGRFISLDPIMDLTDPQQIHGYTYANNNPLTFSDPTGLLLSGLISYIKKTVNSARAAARSAGSSRGVRSVGAAPVTGTAPAGGLSPPASTVTNALWSPSGSTSAVQASTPEQELDKVTDHLKDTGESAWNFFTDLVTPDVESVQECVAGPGLTRPCGWAALEIPVAKPVKAVFKFVENIVDLVKPARKKSEVPSCSSFIPGTHILLADGKSKPVEDIEIGDQVVATDPVTGETEARTVTAEITSIGKKNLVAINLGDTTVVATDAHPFWVPELDLWVDATDLTPGTWLRTSAGAHTQITTIHRWTQPTTVHNLTVEGTHTYYVLAGGTPVLVHNCNGRDLVDGGLDDDTYDRIDGAHGPDVADGVDHQVRRMHDGSSTAADHDLPGIGHDPDALASYFASWRGKMTHTDTRTGSRVAYDPSRGVLIVTTGRNIHGFRYSQGAFESGRYVTP
jgi:RHS repeat-associated protein